MSGNDADGYYMINLSNQTKTEEEKEKENQTNKPKPEEEKQTNKPKPEEEEEQKTNQLSKKTSMHTDNVQYQPVGKRYTVEEIEEIGGGEFDEYRFYNLKEGGFFDPEGYRFDKDGYDEYGGYYDKDGYYIPGEKYQDAYYESYNDTGFEYEYGDEEDYDEEDKLIDDLNWYTGEKLRIEYEIEEVKKGEEKEKLQSLEEELKQVMDGLDQTYQELDAIRDKEQQAMINEHVIPAIHWLSFQENKKFAIKLANLPPKANENQILNFLEQKHRVPGLKDCKLVLDRDEQLYSKCVAWLATDNRDTIRKILYLHNKSFGGYNLKCYLMGYSYSTLLDEEEDQDYYHSDLQLERRLMKMRFEENKQKKKKQEEQKNQ